MSYQQLDRFTGESWHEAKTRAEQKYGKDNYVILTTKTVKHPIYFGLGHKELVEITIGIKRADSTQNKVPARPLPSVELNMPKQQTLRFAPPEQQIGTSVCAAEPKPKKQAAQAPAKPVVGVVAPKIGARRYASVGGMAIPHQSPMREVHSLRTIQEGNLEPQPSHIAAQDIDIILSHMLAIKNERKRREKTEFAELGAQNEAESKPTYKYDNGPDVRKTISSMHERLNQIYSMLSKVNGTADIITDQTTETAPQKKLPRGLSRVKQALEAIETPTSVAGQVMAALEKQLPFEVLNDPNQAMSAALDWLENQVSFSSGLELKNRDEPVIIALIGPTGVGKTTTLAKLAASYRFGSQCSLALFNVDTYRIGATEQLDIYAQITGADIEVICNPTAMQEALNKHKDKDLIMVDTAGRSQKAKQDIEELSKYIGKLPNPRVFLVMSSTSKYSDMVETIKSFSRVGFEGLIFTKTDETNTVGPLLAALFETKKSLAYITTGQIVPTDFRVASFEFFREQLSSAL